MHTACRQRLRELDAVDGDAERRGSTIGVERRRIGRALGGVITAVAEGPRLSARWPRPETMSIRHLLDETMQGNTPGESDDADAARLLGRFWM
jgi:hypothetical protein